MSTYKFGKGAIEISAVGLGWYTIGDPFRKPRPRWKIKGIKTVFNNSASPERDWLRVLFSHPKWEYEQMSKMKYPQVKKAIWRAIKESKHG